MAAGQHLLRLDAVADAVDLHHVAGLPGGGIGDDAPAIGVPRLGGPEGPAVDAVPLDLDPPGLAAAEPVLAVAVPDPVLLQAEAAHRQRVLAMCPGAGYERPAGRGVVVVGEPDGAVGEAGMAVVRHLLPDPVLAPVQVYPLVDGVAAAVLHDPAAIGIAGRWVPVAPEIGAVAVGIDLQRATAAEGDPGLPVPGRARLAAEAAGAGIHRRARIRHGQCAVAAGVVVGAGQPDRATLRPVLARRQAPLREDDVGSGGGLDRVADCEGGTELVQRAGPAVPRPRGEAPGEEAVGRDGGGVRLVGAGAAETVPGDAVPGRIRLAPETGDAGGESRAVARWQEGAARIAIPIDEDAAILQPLRGEVGACLHLRGDDVLAEGGRQREARGVGRAVRHEPSAPGIARGGGEGEGEDAVRQPALCGGGPPE